jgi:hypothetical protein
MCTFYVFFNTRNKTNYNKLSNPTRSSIFSTAPVEEILPQPPTLELSTAPVEDEAAVNIMVKAANVLYHEASVY